MRKVILLLLVILALLSTVDASRKWKRAMASTSNEGETVITAMHAIPAPSAPIVPDIIAASAAAATHGRAALAKNKHAQQRSVSARDLGDPCVNDTDCSYIACTVPTCNLDDNTCIYPTRNCTLPEDSCVTGAGVCNPDFDMCFFTVLDCDDYNNCTTDSCEYNVTESTNQCKNEPIPDCSPDCTHQVNITLDVTDMLNVTSHFDGSVLEFCQTTNYLGPQSTVILSFDPYIPCNLNRRGTCDSKFGFNETIISMCVNNTGETPAPCNGTEIGYTMNLQGISPTLQWNNTDDLAVFVFDPNPVGHLKGLLVDPGISNLFLVVDIWFSDATWAFFGPVPPGSPVLDMDPDCYNGTVDTTQWWYYNDMHGTIEGVNGTDYEGLIITVDRYGPSPQYGFGANNQNSNLGMYATFTWTIVSQPTNPLYNVTEPGGFSILFFDINGPCPDPNVYCELMGEPNYDYPDSWTPVLSESDTLITYCTNFTVHELINCKSFYDLNFLNGSLFQITNSGECVGCAVTYLGTLYETTVMPSDCENWPFSCGETIVRSSCYNLSLTLEASGTAEVRFFSGALDFDVQWLANMWLCGPDAGNLQMVIRTRINQNGNNNTELCNPEVDLLTETGYPLEFAAPLAPDCVIVNVSGQIYCYQEWILRTYDGTGVVDFSGFKKLTWDVCDGLAIIGHVDANVDLRARHTGDQSHLDGKATAELDLYLEGDFDEGELYNNEILTDCDRLYGSICLTNHQHLDILARSAMICYSTIRDLVPFDPLDPDNTGCNTPGPDVVQVLIYSCDPVMQALINLALHDFYFINHPDETSKCNYFSFKVSAYTRFSQILRVTWCAQENGGQPGDSGMVEFYNEFHMDDGSNHVVRAFDHHDHEHFSVECPPNWFFDWNLHECHGSHGDHHHGGVVCTDEDCDHHHHGHDHHTHHDDDDDHDDHDHHDDDDDDEDWSPVGWVFGFLFFLFLLGLVIFSVFRSPAPEYHPPHRRRHHRHRPPPTNSYAVYDADGDYDMDVRYVDQ